MSKKPSNRSRPKTKNIRFNFYAPEARAVSMVGDFNGWEVNSFPMKRDSKGSWKAGVSLQPGRYEYRFWVDFAWQDDPGTQEKVPNPFGSHNCIKIVG
jgi:1,4-alpha-glucan branching enzyme